MLVRAVGAVKVGLVQEKAKDLCNGQCEDIAMTQIERVQGWKAS